MGRGGKRAGKQQPGKWGKTFEVQPASHPPTHRRLAVQKSGWPGGEDGCSSCFAFRASTNRKGGAVRWVFPSRTRREKRDDDYAILAGVFFWFYFSSIPAGGICIRRNEGESFRRWGVVNLSARWPLTGHERGFRLKVILPSWDIIILDFRVELFLISILNMLIIHDYYDKSKKFHTLSFHT